MTCAKTWACWLAALILVGLLLHVGCGDSGCPEGQRMYQGRCIPDSSDGDSDLPDGDYIKPSDGDEPDPDGDTDGPGLSGSGRCGDPYMYGNIQYRTILSENGQLESMSGNLTGASCLEDGVDTETAILGRGPEVVLMLPLIVGDRVHLSFGGSTFDSIVYVLSQCAESAQCLSDVANLMGEGESERLVFTAEYQGDHYIIMDSTSLEATGAWSYTLELQNDSLVDGDGDPETDGDVLDGDETPDGDENPDGDEDGDDETDGDTDSEGEFLTLDASIAGTYPIADSTAVPGAFSELYWRVGGITQLYTINDFGLVTLTPHETEPGFQDPLFSSTEESYRGMLFIGGAPVFLNKTERMIQGSLPSNIPLPAAFGSEPTGLAYLNGAYYASDGINKRLYVFTYNAETTSWVFDSFGFPSFGTLAGVTSGANALWVLNTTETDSYIHRITPATGATEAIYVREGTPLSGISYNADQAAMWASHASMRRVLRMNRTFLETAQ